MRRRKNPKDAKLVQLAHAIRTMAQYGVKPPWMRTKILGRHVGPKAS